MWRSMPRRVKCSRIGVTTKSRIALVFMAGALFTGAYVLSAFMAPSAVAADISQDAARDLRRAGTILALEEILDLVRERHPDARLLEAELERDDGRYIYEMEVLTREGQVRELETDAATGRILEDEAED